MLKEEELRTRGEFYVLATEVMTTEELIEISVLVIKRYCISLGLPPGISALIKTSLCNLPTLLLPPPEVY